MADLLMIVSWLFNINAPRRWCVRNVPPAKTAFVGLVENVPHPVSSTKSISVQNFQNHLMFVTVAQNAAGAPWKNTYTGLPMLKKSMNW